MKGKKEIVILFFIIAVLLFYIYSDKKNVTNYDLPKIVQIDSEEISKLTINNKGLEIILIKDNDRWLVGDRKYPANSSIVNKMLDDITSLKLTALASESNNYNTYELDMKKRIELTAYSEATPVRKIIIGKPASSYRHTFVMIGDDHRVFHASGNIRNDFDKTVSDLRDKKVMTFTEEIAEIVIEKDTEKMTIVRSVAPISVDPIESSDPVPPPEVAGQKWVTANGNPVKDDEIDGFIRMLANLTCDEFIEDKTKEDFESPIFVATLDGAKKYTISIYEKQEDKYTAVSSESEYPFLIAESKANQIMKDFDSLK
jgi:hypothetical protein